MELAYNRGGQESLESLRQFVQLNAAPGQRFTADEVQDVIRNAARAMKDREIEKQEIKRQENLNRDKGR